MTTEEVRIHEIYKRALASSDGRECTPVPFQLNFATQPVANAALHLPTGSGKTATAVLAWIFQRETNPDRTPRRLIYCLPLRALVEQTFRSIKLWLKRLNLTSTIDLVALLGGEGKLDDDWSFSPDRDLIAVTTQDMALSRALNRGYAMNRYRWPVQFALLNNDALWVMDEVQLAGSGLATSTQLQAFRENYGTSGPTATWWMSATMDKSWLKTVDFDPDSPAITIIQLDTTRDLADVESPISKCYYANKPIKQVKGIKPAALLKEHKAGTLTLVVVNTVARAQSLYRELNEEIERGKEKTKPKALLLHSRYRRKDRMQAHTRLVAADQALRPGTQPQAGEDEWLSAVRDAGVVVIATQVVEAGLDFSARLLITELAPWASLVQRFGRCNRRGEHMDALIEWLDLKKSGAAPYDINDLTESRRRLGQLRDSNARIENLEELGPPEREPPAAVIRRKDLLGLFSTEKDLAGGFTDVSRFVRDIEQEADSFVFWRNFKGKPAQEAAPGRNEICRVRCNEKFREFAAQSGAWEWDSEAASWVRRSGRDIRPGMTLLLPCSAGGYSSDIGWTGHKADIPVDIGERNSPPDSMDDEWRSQTRCVRLSDHLEHARIAADQILRRLKWPDPSEKESIVRAAYWHDVGKALAQWQEKIEPAVCADMSPLAKFPRQKRFRPGLRHEAASALAAWQNWVAGATGWNALTVYLIACHHGKVRTVLRSRGRDGQDVFGVCDGADLQLPGWIDHGLRLSNEPKSIGAAGRWTVDGATFEITAPSWMDMTADLVGLPGAPSAIPEKEPRRLGPFRLAMLEAVVVAADVRASDHEEEDSEGGEGEGDRREGR